MKFSINSSSFFIYKSALNVNIKGNEGCNCNVTQIINMTQNFC